MMPKQSAQSAPAIRLLLDVEVIPRINVFATLVTHAFLRTIGHGVFHVKQENTKPPWATRSACLAPRVSTQTIWDRHQALSALTVHHTHGRPRAAAIQTIVPVWQGITVVMDNVRYVQRERGVRTAHSALTARRTHHH